MASRFSENLWTSVYTWHFYYKCSLSFGKVLLHTHTHCSSSLNFEFTQNLFQSCLVLNPLYYLGLLLELFRVWGIINFVCCVVFICTLLPILWSFAVMLMSSNVPDSPNCLNSLFIWCDTLCNPLNLFMQCIWCYSIFISSFIS
jgi:hypothetical protein